MCSELNDISIKLSKYDWITVMQSWVEYIQSQYNEYIKTRYLLLYFLRYHYVQNLFLFAESLHILLFKIRT